MLNCSFTHNKTLIPQVSYILLKAFHEAELWCLAWAEASVRMIEEEVWAAKKKASQDQCLGTESVCNVFLEKRVPEERCPSPAL